MPSRPVVNLAACVAAALIASACGADAGGAGAGPGSPPRGLTYSSGFATYVVGTAIPPNVPSWSGGTPSAFAAQSPLPPGLRIDPSTGVITGTPTAAAAAATYVVAAGNELGYTYATLTIAVGTAPPATAGSCVNMAIGPGMACAEVSPTFPLDIRQECAQLPGATYSPQPCATTGRVGRCVMSNPGGFSMTVSFYASAGEAQSWCTGTSGQSGFTNTWTPG